jgi:DNA topoisomerase VI subunit B
MRLGVLKELRPKLVATFTEKPGSCEGHPFIVEAAVSIGGAQMREGVNVYRFANRIPLLFETGADVVTQVKRQIKYFF